MSFMSPHRVQVVRLWSVACQTFFAAVMEHCGPYIGVDMVRILIGGGRNLYGANPFEERADAAVKALEWMKLNNVHSSYCSVADELIGFARYFDMPDERLPTCADLESWYSRVRGQARNLLERRVL